MAESVQNKLDTEQILEVAHQWILTMEGPNATQKDQVDLERWLNASPRHRDLYDQAITFRAAVGEMRPADFDDDVLAPSLNERITDFFDGSVRAFRAPKFRLAAWGALATAFAIGVLAPPTMQRAARQAELTPFVAEYATELGKTTTVLLRDGTEVSLGPSSKISTRFTAHARQIELHSGSGFFVVADDAYRPFSVRAGDLTTTAIGTEFDVRKGVDSFRVAVAEGKVEVSFPRAVDGEASAALSRKTLGAGQQVVASGEAGLRPITSVNPAHVGAWRQGKLVYSGETLADVLYDANRYSTVPIRIAPGSEGIRERRTRGVFLGSDVDRLLASIALIHDLEIDRSDPEQVLLREKM